MNLTPEVKEEIDRLDFHGLLKRWRFGSAASPWFQGESGEYFKNRMTELQLQDPGAAVQVSKDLGWT